MDFCCCSVAGRVSQIETDRGKLKTAAHQQPCPPRLSAFTLVELLAVVAIIAVLAILAASGAGTVRAAANKAKCLSNQRQIGLALINYANENGSEFPPTTHTTGPFGKGKSWIFELAPYLDDSDAVRVCPADPPERQKRIRAMGATSYVLNDLVFDSYDYNRLVKIPRPSKTLLISILSEKRAPSLTRDHIHGDEWNTWGAALNDIEPDRHRSGARAPDRMNGSSNYLFADGHAENITAREFKARFDAGINPAAIPID